MSSVVVVVVVQDCSHKIRVRCESSPTCEYLVERESIIDHWPNVSGLVRDCLNEGLLELWLDSPDDLQMLIEFMTCTEKDSFIEKNYLPVDERCVRGLQAANYVGDERLLSRLSRLLADHLSGLDDLTS